VKGKLIDGVALAQEIKNEIASQVNDLNSNHNMIPGLAAILVGEDPASQIYVNNKGKAASQVGMTSKVFKLPNDTSEKDLITLIECLNNDSTFHGILVQLPLPSKINEDKCIETISPTKDVDGLHPVNVGLLVSGKPRFISATPAGIQQMILRNGYSPEGKHVVICGRSNIVGKPIANLLMQRLPGSNATVTLCHSKTKDLGFFTRQADILIAAIGQPKFVTRNMVKDGVIVIDVGINRIAAPERKRGYKLVGDVDFDSVSEKAIAITPVPGGVGPMTIAMLLNNTLKAAQLSINTNSFI
jgi:methylenetetrahydrofolate dehydrogenase (NADP+)/methenyltetrahydrofolate cyclohydrolase